jgi:tetratricopeptide (TPR) repeat protein
MNQTNSAQTAQLERLQGYLVLDPANSSLVGDTASCAIAAGEPLTALKILDDFALLEPLTPPLLNVAGLAALASQDFKRASEVFRALLDSSPDSCELRYNLAFSTSRLDDINGALALLDQPTTHLLPQAAVLKVQLQHFSGLFEEAIASAKDLLAYHSEDTALLGTASVLAMDLEDKGFAQACAQKSLDLYVKNGRQGSANIDAMTTIGYLALDEGDQASASQLFDEAIAAQPFEPRAWIGRGLAQVSRGDFSQGALDITNGAAMFKDHLGSWIAAGWAHVLGEDLVSARKVFEKTLALDPTFSESHGSLGVVEFMEGNIDIAKSLASRALRLDRESFSGALLTSMLLSGAGKADEGTRIFKRALTTPIDANGRTLLDAMARMGIKQ